jgi:hypothetical protein
MVHRSSRDFRVGGASKRPSHTTQTRHSLHSTLHQALPPSIATVFDRGAALDQQTVQHLLASYPGSRCAEPSQNKLRSPSVDD